MGAYDGRDTRADLAVSAANSRRRKAITTILPDAAATSSIDRRNCPSVMQPATEWPGTWLMMGFWQFSAGLDGNVYQTFRPDLTLCENGTYRA